MKKLYESNLFFRYLTTFSCIILIIIILLILEKSIPNNRVRNNILKSESYYTEYYDSLFSNLDNFKSRNNMFDSYGDLSHLSNIYLEDYKHPIKEFIEMNIDSQLSKKIIRGEGFSSIKMDTDYSRYWHANVLLLKPLLTFFTMNTITIIYLLILIISFTILLVKSLKHSKLLGVMLTIGAVMINMFFVSNCDNFFYIFIITIISSIYIIKMYERKSKNIDLLFLVNGILTACFDALSCGTLSITIPLFIYIYLHMIDKKKIKFKKILFFVLLWLLGWSFSYFIKWIILVIHYRGGFKERVLDPLLVRVGSGEEQRVTVFIRSIIGVPKYLYPFNLNILLDY